MVYRSLGESISSPTLTFRALSPVYGMPGIGLMLSVLRSMNAEVFWQQKYIQFVFWAINIGLALMVLISVLPVGPAQTWVSVKYGLWSARSADFMQGDTLSFFRWLRVIGDTIFALGNVSLAWFIVGLKTGWSIEKK